MIDNYCQEEQPPDLTALWAVLGLLLGGGAVAVIVYAVYYFNFRNADEINAQKYN